MATENKTLTAGTDYTLTYGNNVNASALATPATCTVTGIGNFAGSAGSGQFMITPCSLKVVARNVEKIYWDADPALEYDVYAFENDDFSKPGLYGSDALTGELAYVASTPVGKFDITRGTLSGGNNYDIVNFEPGEFEIYYFKGDGASEATAYEIGTARQLAGLAELANVAATNSDFGDKYYKLTADINLTGAWTPIGTSAANQNFRGHFNGNGKIVKGLNVSGSGSNRGLFGYINGGSVRNLGVEGTVSGTQSVGDVVGYITGGSITNCYSSVVVNGTSTTVGGVAGYAENNSQITNCYATGAVTGNSSVVCGVVGTINRSSITNCYATGAVNGTNFAGGITNVSTGTTGSSITNCVALNPSITRTSGSNTIFGRVLGQGTATNCLAWSGMEALGGIPAFTDGGVNGTGIDKTAAKTQATYEELGWEFGDGKPWKWGGAAYPLPVLNWQEAGTYPALPPHLQ